MAAANIRLGQGSILQSAQVQTTDHIPECSFDRRPQPYHAASAQHLPAWLVLQLIRLQYLVNSNDNINQSQGSGDVIVLPVAAQTTHSIYHYPT